MDDESLLILIPVFILLRALVLCNIYVFSVCVCVCVCFEPTSIIVLKLVRGLLNVMYYVKHLTKMSS